jgi:transcriptional regulator with GAF, ATPase, and Fis domain
MRQALERTGGNRTHAARLLGLTRHQILYRLQKPAPAGLGAGH